MIATRLPTVELPSGRAPWCVALLGALLSACSCGASRSSASGDAERPPVPSAIAASTAPSAPAPSADASAGDAGASGASLAPSASRCEGVSLKLRNARLESGVLMVDAYLENAGSRPYALMATGDGSSDGRRNPSLRFSLEPADVKPPAACGLMNALTEADFFTLAPGASKKLEWMNAPQPAHPGTYTLRATYINDPRTSAGLEDGDPKKRFEARVRETVPCVVTSAPIDVRVK